MFYIYYTKTIKVTIENLVYLTCLFNSACAIPSMKKRGTFVGTYLIDKITHACYRHHFSKFPDFSLIKIKLP